MSSKAGKSNKAFRNTELPLTRVRTIMKSSPEVTSISQEAVYLITHATELFVVHLANLALKAGDSKKGFDYKDLAEVVNKKSTMEFLTDIIPKKIVAKDYMKMWNTEKKINEDDYL